MIEQIRRSDIPAALLLIGFGAEEHCVEWMNERVNGRMGEWANECMSTYIGYAG